MELSALNASSATLQERFARLSQAYVLQVATSETLSNKLTDLSKQEGELEESRKKSKR